ncbi:hypothetical protein DN748_18805 [Sinomicrobium soli]|nr:hypothetical protein DN748_18805 [Sinomicrobium sp. N-1-3-6]
MLREIKRNNVIMRYFYYLSVAVSVFILALYLFGPYGGVLGIFSMMKNGFYDHDYIVSSFGTRLSSVVLYLNQFVAFLFFGATILCIGTVFFFRMIAVRKYRIGVWCLVIVAFIVLFPKLYHFFASNIIQ